VRSAAEAERSRGLATPARSATTAIATPTMIAIGARKNDQDHDRGRHREHGPEHHRDHDRDAPAGLAAGVELGDGVLGIDQGQPISVAVDRSNSTESWLGISPIRASAAPAFDPFRGQSGAPQPHGPNGLSALADHSNRKRDGCHSLSAEGRLVVYFALPFLRRSSRSGLLTSNLAAPVSD
jgi:hypothetical protein